MSIRNLHSYAGLFLDFENIFHYIRKRTVDSERAHEILLEVIVELRKKLAEEHNLACIVQFAYADFEQIEVNAQSQLFLLGVETRNVMGTGHKNAADMRMCIDIMETMYTRSEIDTFILVAGDRDYIPVIQHLKKQARSVYVVAFKENISGDLHSMVSGQFIDAKSVLGKISLSELEVGQGRIEETLQIQREVSNERAEKLAEDRAVGKAPAAVFERTQRLDDRSALIALEVMLHNFGDKPEVWFTPYLNKLRNELQHLAEYERKALISTLEMAGAIKVEKRRGDPHDYSVIVVNWNHPDVIENNPETAA
jgi:uncharacterized LabA/DUF88 family protein